MARLVLALSLLVVAMGPSAQPAQAQVVLLAVGMSNTFMEFRDFARLGGP